MLINQLYELLVHKIRLLIYVIYERLNCIGIKKAVS